MASLGIDFGSSFSTVSWLNPQSGKPEAVRFGGDGQVKYPSAMLYTENGFVMGFQAASYLDALSVQTVDTRIEMMSNFIPSLKRIIEPGMEEVFADKSFTHEELLRKFLGQIIDKAKLHCGHGFVIDRISFSYPVNYSQAKIQMMTAAFHQLGCTDVQPIYEPVAAAEGYGINHKIEEGEGILVFDFGGGTIDVAYVKKVHGKLQIVTEPKGNNLCGGQDIDFLLYENLRARILNELHFDISEQGLVDQVILKNCRWLKEQFSEDGDTYSTDIGLVCNGRFQTYKYRLSRDSFDTIISSKVDEAIGVAKQVVQAVRSSGYTIDKVLLIGGSSRLTLVRNQLEALLRNTSIDTCGESDIAVALGNISAFIVPDETDGTEVPPITKPLEESSEFDEELNTGKHMTCRQCGSERCYKLVHRLGYHCLDCGWEGKNITVKF